MQPLLNCSLTSKLREENHLLKQCSTQEAFRKIEELLSFALDEVIPPKQIFNKRSQRCWINNEVKNSCLKKQKCFQAYLKSNTCRDRSIYTKQRNITNTLVQKTKYNFFEKFFSKDNDSGKRLNYKFVKKKVKSEPEATIAGKSNLPTAAPLR